MYRAEGPTMTRNEFTELVSDAIRQGQPKIVDTRRAL
jgi:hypothetical protein